MSSFFVDAYLQGRTEKVVRGGARFKGDGANMVKKKIHF